MSNKAQQLKDSIRRYMLTVDNTMAFGRPYNPSIASISATISTDYMSRIAMLCYWGDNFTGRVDRTNHHATRNELSIITNILFSCYHNFYEAEKQRS